MYVKPSKLIVFCLIGYVLKLEVRGVRVLVSLTQESESSQRGRPIHDSPLVRLQLDPLKGAFEARRVSDHVEFEFLGKLTKATMSASIPSAVILRLMYAPTNDDV